MELHRCENTGFHFHVAPFGIQTHSPGLICIGDEDSQIQTKSVHGKLNMQRDVRALGLSGAVGGPAISYLVSAVRARSARLR